MRTKTTFLCLISISLAAMAIAKAPVQQPMPPSVGIAVGEKAPGFALRDQFDRTQSNQTLKGEKGTILLFFRSADW